MSNSNPLVSICIIAYNSENTIIETLNSVLEQTYKHLELIISDDCSKDNTVTIVQNWLEKNKSRFVNSRIITVAQNTGVTANCNRAVKIAKGEFIKDFGADDILLPTYVEDCVQYFQQNPSISVLFTKQIPFDENDRNKVVELNEDYDFLKKNQQEQKDYIKKIGIPFLPTPTSIYRRNVLQECDYFDERIPMWEDGPMYHKLAEKGFLMAILDKYEVMYRVRNDSLSNLQPVSHIISLSKYYFLYKFNNEIKYNFAKAMYHCFTNFLGINYNKKICKKIYNLLFNRKSK